jgi:ADP-heptose:LPS heptosyltransferase
MKILIWKIGALGDVVMTTPLIRQLRLVYPDAQIDYLVGQSSALILRGNPYLSNLITFDESILVQQQVLRLRELFDVMRGYDVLLTLDKHWIFGLLGLLTRTPKRIGFARTKFEGVFHTKRVPYRELRHEIHYYLMLGQVLNEAINLADTTLELPPATPCLLEKPYTILINSGGENFREHSAVRRMPHKLFSELSRYYASCTKVVYVGSQPEHSLYEAFSYPTAVNLCGELTLQEVWSVLKNAEAIICTDSGLMHMAAAVNPCVTAVFGPTHPARKCPPGARWAWADSDTYDPCYELFGKIPSAEFFSSLSVDSIINATSTLPFPTNSAAHEK